MIKAHTAKHNVDVFYKRNMEEFDKNKDKIEKIVNELINEESCIGRYHLYFRNIKHALRTCYPESMSWRSNDIDNEISRLAKENGYEVYKDEHSEQVISWDHL